MIVYKFYSKKYGLMALNNERLKITTLKELNDPFEFSALFSTDKIVRQALKTARDKTFEKCGVICFSKSWSNPVLWSHYADCHKGIVLGFDIPDILLAHVIYKTGRLEISTLENSPNFIFSKEFQDNAMRTKYEHWQYENEARIYCELDNVDIATGHYFRDFDERMKLKEVILGALYEPENNEKINKQLQDTNIIIKTSRLAFQSFSVVHQKNPKLTKRI